MKFINPYAGIDFATVPKVNAISHEHITQSSGDNSLKVAYDRGIRWFANVWYQPAIPKYPLTGWAYEYLDYVNTEPNDLSTELTDRYAVGAMSDFQDKDGNTVHIADLPAVPNAEHPKFAWDKTAATPSIMDHFNVLGNLWPEVGHDVGAERMAKIQAHPLWDLADINTKFTAELLYTGKVFGTINHNANVLSIERMLNNCPAIFRAMELFNQGYTASENQNFRNAYDTILRHGYRIWALAVADWQGDIERRTPVEDRESDGINRGCNVLLIPGYDGMTVAQKSEAGLDAYIAGKYYASGFGRHRITGLTASAGRVSLAVDGTPSKIRVVTSSRKYDVPSRNSVSVEIQPGEMYIRFEVFYYDAAKTDMDFIFTNPIFIEDNEGIAQRILLEII